MSMLNHNSTVGSGLLGTGFSEEFGVAVTDSSESPAESIGSSKSPLKLDRRQLHSVSPATEGRASRVDAEIRNRPVKEQIAVGGSESETRETRSFLLWIDGVGVWQILMGNHFLIGAPSSKPPEADLAIQANVRKQHASIKVENEDWILDPLAETCIAGRRILKKAHLQSGDQIQLGESVKLGFRIPSPLSNSAVLDFESPHRPLQSVDGVILLTDHCIVGPRKDQHVFCGTWQHSFVLFRRELKLLCRSSGDFQMNGDNVEDVCEIETDSMIESEHCRFRVEVIR